MLIKQIIPQKLKNIWHLFVAICANIYFANPSRNLFVVGITGTDGKTTTSTLVYHLLKAQNKKVALISTVAAQIGTSKLDTGFHVTSPDPWMLQSLLQQIKNQGFTYVVLETTSHGLDQHRLFGIKFKLGILTNISHEHLDYHGTMGKYIQAKVKLFQHSQIALLNKKDPHYYQIKAFIPNTTQIRTYPSSEIPQPVKHAIRKRFPQKFNRLNAQAAAMAVYLLTNSFDSLDKAFIKFPGIAGRMEQIPNHKGFNTIVDFAHTPNALKNALTSLRKITSGKIIAVFGSAGLRDKTKRPLMGKIASSLADEVVLTAEDPRTESVWSIIDQIMVGVTTNHGHMHKIPDRQQAINFAVSLAKKGDTVAVFGKGHEKSMCFGRIEHPWSDQEAIRKALNQNAKK